jgi:hypothetical protein
MRTYNRRLARIARRRRRLKALGQSNRARRHLIPGFTLRPTDVTMLVKALAKWLWLELSEGWHSWGETAGRQRDEVSGSAAERRACAVVNH